MRQHGGVLFRTHFERIHVKKLPHLRDLNIEFSGEPPDDRRMNAIPYKHLVITGKNGSGKTALLSSIHKCLVDFEEDNEKKELTSPALELEFYGQEKEGFISDFRKWFKDRHFVYCYFPANGRLDDNQIKDLSGFLQGLKIKANDGSIESVKFAQIIKDFESDLKELFALENDFTFVFKSDTDVYLWERNGREHPFTRLPHGFKALLGVFGTLRNVVHKQGSEPSTAKGLVLIDEPELHLHVAWQKTFMTKIVKMFPNIQFIIATHSPFILNSVSNAVVFDLEKQIHFTEMTMYSNKGLVEHYFNTDMYSEEIKDKYEQYMKLIDKSDRTNDDEKDLARIREEFFMLTRGIADELILAVKMRELEQEDD